MATGQAAVADVPKPSFAKVAASASKENVPITTVRQVTGPARGRASQPGAATQHPAIISNDGVNKPTAEATAPPPQTNDDTPQQGKGEADDKITDGLKNLTLAGKAPSLVVNGSGSAMSERVRAANRDGGSDDSQRADSSSELGTKPPSLDGKSITSGTTFALDEKESLRPDDSASVKAAAEDDDAFSIRGSLFAGSRMGSELAARARGIQLGDIPERQPYPMPGTNQQGVITPQSGSSEQQPNANTMPLANVPASDALNAIYRQAPDEKLLEAMQSPKDRLFLLRLEKDVIGFVQDSKEPYMDLPPSNSFCRMLTHKLADYYHMTHSYEPHIQAVRIFRTPFCRVPQSLASIGVSSSGGSTPPPVVLPKKIMRRGQDGEMAPVSATPSKPASEVGSDVKEKAAPTKEKLSREEREEAYNRARERIFGNSEKTGESTPENDENGVSRASSVSARDKSNLAKKGKANRRRGSDSFDSRNQYAPFWGPQQQTWASQPQYVPVANPQFNAQYGAQVPPQFTNQMAPVYAPPNQVFPPMMPNAGYPGYNAMPPYQQPPANQQRYIPPAPNPTMGTYGPPVPPVPPVPSGPQPNWQTTNFNPGPYPPRGPPVPVPSGIPYAYGQLPANVNPYDPKTQHPIPGSYNRHAFNPNTKSFVPGNGSSPVLPPQPPFAAPGSHHGSPQIGSPHLVYAGYQQPVPPQGYGGNAGYGMAQQGSSNSMPAYMQPGQQLPPIQHPPPPHPPAPPPSIPQGPHHLAQNPPPHIPSKPAPPQGPTIGGHTYTHLPNYGNPATLPQKPTPTGV